MVKWQIMAFQLSLISYELIMVSKHWWRCAKQLLMVLEVSEQEKQKIQQDIDKLKVITASINIYRQSIKNLNLIILVVICNFKYKILVI